MTGTQQFVNLPGDGFAYAGDFFEFPLFPIFVDVAPQRRQVFGNFAIGQCDVNYLAFDFQQVGDQSESVGQFTVVHDFLLAICPTFGELNLAFFHLDACFSRCSNANIDCCIHCHVHRKLYSPHFTPNHLH